jgi:CRISPR-associated protein Csn2
MKMKIFPLDNEIIFDDTYVNILEIEDNCFFAKIVNEINNLVNGETSTERILLIDNDEIIDMSKNAIFVIDIFNVEYNQKKIITKLYQKIEEIYKLEYEIKQNIEIKTEEIIKNFNMIFEDFSFEIDFKVELTVQDYLKLLSVKIDTSQYITPIEKVLGLLDIAENFKLCKILMFCNLKSYFSKIEMQEIYKYSKYKKMYLLLFESKCSEEIFQYEKKIIIDENYDDFLIQV